MHAPVLICAAVEEELAALPPSFEPTLSGWSGRLGARPALARAVGIGPVEAALGTRGALAAAPAAAIFVGTCGAFPGSGLAIGDVVVIDRAVLASSDEAAGLSYLPGRQRTRVDSDPDLCTALAAAAGIARAGAATVVAITRDGERARLLRERTGCAAEHQEAFGFLLAATQAGVPAACVLGVANEVGPDAHAQWLHHAGDAAARALESVRRWAARL